MTIHINLLILITVSFVGLWSGGIAQAERLTEPRGLVTFDMPDGWDNSRFKNGRHFTRTGLPDDPNILGVVPEARDKYMTMATMRAGRKQVHAMQEHRQVFEKMTRMKGFEVWEVVVEATIRDQDVVLHTFLMISDTLMVDVHLNASKSVYEQYLPDLRRLVKSVAGTGNASLRQ